MLSADAPLALVERLGRLVQAAGGGGKEPEEGPGRAQHPAEVFGMELHTHKPGVVLDLDDLHPLALDVLTDEGKTGLLDLVDHGRVDLVPVAMTLLNLRHRLSIERPQTGPLRILLEDARVLAEPHGSTQLALVDLRHVDDRVILGMGMQFLASHILDTDNVLAVFQHGQLHTETHTQEGGLVGPRPFNRLHHTLRTPNTEAAGDENTISGADRMPGLVEVRRGRGLLLEMRRVHPDHLQLLVAVHGSVLQCLGHTDIRVMESGVLSNQRNRHGVVKEILTAGQIHPVLPHAAALLDPRGGVLFQVQHLGHCVNELLLFKEQRHVVGCCDVVDGNDLVLLDGAHVGDLLDRGLLQGLFAAARNQVGVETSTPHITDGSLRGFRLLLAAGARGDHGHVGHVDLNEVALAGLPLQLAQGVDERGTLDISDGSTQLDDADVRLGAGLVDGDLRDALDPFLDGVGDVGHDLHGLAEVVADTFVRDDVLVDLAGGDVVVPSQGREEVPLVVAQVEIHFTAVIGHIDLTVPSKGR